MIVPDNMLMASCSKCGNVTLVMPVDYVVTAGMMKCPSCHYYSAMLFVAITGEAYKPPYDDVYEDDIPF